MFESWVVDGFVRDEMRFQENSGMLSGRLPLEKTDSNCWRSCRPASIEWKRLTSSWARAFLASIGWVLVFKWVISWVVLSRRSW